MLSKSELLKYGTGTLTPAFIDRVFQECLTYEGEMDYKTYLDFVLALENRKDPQEGYEQKSNDVLRRFSGAKSSTILILFI